MGMPMLLTYLMVWWSLSVGNLRGTNLLKYVKCSGFRSLENFHIEFTEGLNILVGPNGSGKTNIILLLEFIGSMRHRGLVEAASLGGGAGRMFRRDVKTGLARKIQVEFGGRRTHFEMNRKLEYDVQYEYRATISLLPRQSAIIFSCQQLIIQASRVGELFQHLEVDIEVNVNDQGEATSNIHKFSPELSRYWIAGTGDKSPFKEQVFDIANYAGNGALYEMFSRIIVGCNVISQDLFGTKALNIDPNRVREPEDIATAPYIKNDGSGFAATMYALQPRIGPILPYRDRYVPERFENPSQTREEIIAHCSLVNESILGIAVIADPFESKLRISLEVAYEGSTIQLPLSFASDGTAKWMALVAAVITTRALFAIEEPENFLHPAMQGEIVKLIRQQYAESPIGGERFALLTTHSESILNSAAPTELIIVEMVDGRTIAKRAKNTAKVNEQISKTGFGLGYYYARGAVQ